MAQPYCISTSYELDCGRNILDVDSDLLPSCRTERSRVRGKQDAWGTGSCADDCLKAGQEPGQDKSKMKRKYRLGSAPIVEQLVFQSGVMQRSVLVSLVSLL